MTTNDELDDLDPQDEAKRRYFKTEKGKAAMRRYIQSDKGKATSQRYYQKRVKTERSLAETVITWLATHPGQTVQDFLEETKNDGTNTGTKGVTGEAGKRSRLPT